MTESDRYLLKNRLEKVQERIQTKAVAVGRDPSDIELIVVTKNKPAAIIKDLVELGIDSVGENYLKETLFKKELLREYDINWHMIGVVQKGKVKHVTVNFCQIHSVDSLELAKEIQYRAANIGKTMPIYLELNLSEEKTKHGWIIKSEAAKAHFFTEAGQIMDFDSTNVRGLMTMAPYSSDPENSRKYYRRLRSIRDQLVEASGGNTQLGLSMGMSSDYEVAIEEGATVLRIGTAIVGER